MKPNDSSPQILELIHVKQTLSVFKYGNTCSEILCERELLTQVRGILHNFLYYLMF